MTTQKERADIYLKAAKDLAMAICAEMAGCTVTGNARLAGRCNECEHRETCNLYVVFHQWCEVIWGSDGKI
jgi:hypothetical protein